METVKYFKADTDDLLWEQLAADLRQEGEVFRYSALLETASSGIYLDIDIDLGGGFEGGYATTTLSSVIQHSSDFRFALHHQDFTDEIGKFFGMEDLETGYTTFDELVVVKTNNLEKLKALLANEAVRETIQSLGAFNFHITRHVPEGTSEQKDLLELDIEEGITDLQRLRQLYDVFKLILLVIENRNNLFY
jgi:hypothetical protein